MLYNDHHSRESFFSGAASGNPRGCLFAWDALADSLGLLDWFGNAKKPAPPPLHLRVVRGSLTNHFGMESLAKCIGKYIVRDSLPRGT